MKHLLTALLLVCSFALVGCGGGAAPSDALTDFFTAMEDGDAEKVKELAPAMGMAGEKLDGMVQQMAVELKKKGGIKEIEILKEEVNGDTATIEFNQHFGDGTKEGPETVELIKIDGNWTIDMGEEMDNKPGGGGSINLGGGEDEDFPADFEVPSE